MMIMLDNPDANAGQTNGQGRDFYVEVFRENASGETETVKQFDSKDIAAALDFADANPEYGVDFWHYDPVTNKTEKMTAREFLSDVARSTTTQPGSTAEDLFATVLFYFKMIFFVWAAAFVLPLLFQLYAAICCGVPIVVNIGDLGMLAATVISGGTYLFLKRRAVRG